MLFLHCILQCFMLFSEIVRSVQVAISARINLTLQFQLQRSNILKVSTTLNPTRSTWRYYTPPPPFCEQQRNLQRNNRFNEATSSRFQQISVTNTVHMTLLPPRPPHVYTITTFIVHDKTEGSWKPWGTPSLEPIYIYIKVHIYMYI